MNQAEKNTIVP